MSATEQVPIIAEGASAPPPPVRSSALVARALRLWRTRIGAALILLLVVVAFVGPYVAPHGASEFVAIPNTPPGGKAGLLGSDYLGQDVFSRFLEGGRSILVMAVVSTAYARNALDDVLMRAMDVIMAFPQIMLALVAVSLIGAKTWVIIAAIALTTAPRVARVTRGAAQPIVERDGEMVAGRRVLAGEDDVAVDGGVGVPGR